MSSRGRSSRRKKRRRVTAKTQAQAAVSLRPAADVAFGGTGPLHRTAESDLRGYCKQVIESLEQWLRRLIDEELTAAFGSEYLAAQEAGNNIINNEIRQSIITRRNEEPGRYARPIDAALLDDEVRIICNPNLFARCFRNPLQRAFPEGVDEARTFFTRLIEPRNRLGHANPISVRQAEQVICYSNDVIDSLKAYYAGRGQESEYNVPTIVRIVDSFGNQIFPQQVRIRTVFLQENRENWLRPGDTLTIEAEVDPAFSPTEYVVQWFIGLGEMVQGSPLVLRLQERHVDESLQILCLVVSNRSWQRRGRSDDSLTLNYRVL